MEYTREFQLKIVKKYAKDKGKYFEHKFNGIIFDKDFYEFDDLYGQQMIDIIILSALGLD
jgi:hypothetical protein